MMESCICRVTAGIHMLLMAMMLMLYAKLSMKHAPLKTSQHAFLPKPTRARDVQVGLIPVLRCVCFSLEIDKNIVPITEIQV